MLDARAFGMMMGELAVTYDSFKVTKEKISLYYRHLQHYETEVIAKALDIHTSKSSYPPTIADINIIANGIVNQGNFKGWEEAWEEVMQSITRYGWRRADEALAQMTERTRQAVKVIGYSMMCLSENLDTMRAHFRDIYNGILARDKNESLLSPKLREDIKQLSNSTLRLEDGKKE